MKRVSEEFHLNTLKQSVRIKLHKPLFLFSSLSFLSLQYITLFCNLDAYWIGYHDNRAVTLHSKVEFGNVVLQGIQK